MGQPRYGISADKQIFDATVQVLYEISNIVTSTRNLIELCEKVHQCLRQKMGVTNFYVGLYEKETNKIEFPFHFDQYDDLSVWTASYLTPDSLTHELITSQKPLFLSRQQLESRYDRKKVVGTLPKIWLGLPIWIKDEVHGCIVTQSYTDPEKFSEADIPLFIWVSEQLALAAERTISETRIKQSQSITQTLYSISNAINTSNDLHELYHSIHQSLGQVLDLSNFIIGLYNQNKKQINFVYYADQYDDLMGKTIPLERSLARDIIDTGAPLFLNEQEVSRLAQKTQGVGTQPKIWLGVPLKVDNEVIGYMGTQSYHDPFLFNRSDLDIFSTVSDQVALAVDRKRAGETIRRNETLAHTLFRISNAVNTTQNLNDLYQSIYESLNMLMDLPNFFICIYQKKSNSMYFPLYVDEYDSEETISFTVEDIGEDSSITTDVIKSKKPLFLTRDILIQKKKENKITGKVPVIWLGIPLIIRDEVIGVMATQHYSDPQYFTQDDMDLFISVSDQVAIAIDRKQSQEIIIEREKQILELSRQTEELSLVAASIISMKDEKEIFDHISKAIVANSDYEKLIISYFTDAPPYREILGYRGIEGHKIEKIIDYHVSKIHFEQILNQGVRIGHFACYLTHEKNDILSQDLLAIFTGGEDTGGLQQEWHPNDMLFIPMNDAEGNLMGVISVGNSKSGNRPTNETVRPLEIFSSLISQIIIVRKIQNELKDHKENLEKIVEGRTKELTTEIKERIQVEKMLKKAKVDAEAAAQAKLEFLANMSHEIRTPINGVMGMAEIALEKEIPEDLRQIFNTIDSEADNLLKIINEILDFSKIEAGKLEIEDIPFDLRTVFEKTCASLAMGLSDDKIEFVSFMPPGVPSGIIGDPGRLRQILINLTSNAIKFTDRGEIFVKCEMIGEQEKSVDLKFTVKDTGIGIPKEKQDHIFDSFSQADGSTTRKYGGTGLGTTISKQLVELMGGRIGLESEPGKGSSFWFCVNLKKQLIKESNKTDRTIADPDKLNILVVANNFSNQFVFESYLKSFGCRSIIVSTAEDALLYFENDAVSASLDLMITDLNLPGKNGFDLAKAIRHQTSQNSMPIILLAGTGTIGDGNRCREIGINGYLTKPVKKEELKLIIGSVMGKISSFDKHDEMLVTRHSIDERAAEKIKILLVEDYPTNQKIALQHLKNAGYQVSLAKNGKQALDAFKSRHFDLILMDIQMPEMDGYEATRHIREHEKKINQAQLRSDVEGTVQFIRTPVIAMTAHAIKGYREKCLEAGMDEYITKPIKKQSFLEMVSRWSLPGTHPQPVSRFQTPEIDDLNYTENGIRPFDFEKALDEFENDKEFLVEVIEEFLENLTQQFKTISNAIKKNDMQTMARQAHAIKGGSANLTAYPMSQTAHELEMAGKSGDLENSEQIFENLKSDFRILKQYLNTLDLF